MLFGFCCATALAQSLTPDATPALSPSSTANADTTSAQLGTSAPARIYIPVGAPNVRRAPLAIEATQGMATVAAEFYRTLWFDMDFSDLFEIIAQDRLPKGTGDMLAYRGVGAEFLLRTSVNSVQGRLEAELRLFDVARGVQILGRRYPLVSSAQQPGRELAHFAANDVIEALTGEPGIFRTRLLMSCGNARKEIYIMDFDGQNVRQITRDGNFAISPSWAADGKRILFTSYKPSVRGGFVNPNLYLVDLQSNQRRAISAAKGLNTGGAFHPREEKIAYTFSQSGRPEIFVLDLIKNIRTPITRTNFFSVEPSWSPDGTRLTFSSSQTGRPHLFVANADGTNSRRITFAGRYNSSPNWSPRGDRIAFSGQENDKNNFNIFMIDPSGSNLARLTDSPHSSENPVFSPDGRFLAYSSNATGTYQIHIMTALGTRIRTISPPQLGHCKQPAWSPRL